MPSSLTWLDHDAAARDRSLRILQFFQERETRDELGLGAIRDSIADQLFPGTSTIQTRLRYMFFVPWLYQTLEEKRVPAVRFAAMADKMERDLIQPLLDSPDNDGAFGKLAGRRVKRLPSSVYWAGLGSWGIRVTPLSQDEYLRRVDAIYRRRNVHAEIQQRRSEIGEDGAPPPLGALTWHPRMPKPPAGFPAEADFHLRKHEAEFLLDRIQRSHPDSLLAHLALHGKPTSINLPWEHPDYAGFRDSHKELLEHARLFSEIKQGAAIVYNVRLAQLRQREDWVGQHSEIFEDWLQGLPLDEIRAWSIERFWELTLSESHTITPRARKFVEHWRALVLNGANSLLASQEAFALVQHREKSLKGPRSRFVNKRALEQWGGWSGLAYLSFRWPNTQTLLNDLYAGLEANT